MAAAAAAGLITKATTTTTKTNDRTMPAVAHAAPAPASAPTFLTKPLIITVTLWGIPAPQKRVTTRGNGNLWALLALNIPPLQVSRENHLASGSCCICCCRNLLSGDKVYMTGEATRPLEKWLQSESIVTQPAQIKRCPNGWIQVNFLQPKM